jgi:hypothetical protein
LGWLNLLEQPSTLPGLLVPLDHKVMLVLKETREMQAHRAPLVRNFAAFVETLTKSMI